MFRLSFQNLIPSGAICNRNIKGQRDLDIKKHLHPYIINEEKIHFKTCMGNDLKIKYSIDACENSKAHNTADFFKLEEIYSCHEYIADKLSELMKEYSRKHIEDLMVNLNTLSQQSSSIIKRGYSKKEIIDIIYSEFKIKEPDNEILGNLKNDLYKLIESFYFESKK